MNYCSNNKYTWFSWAILHGSLCHLPWYSHTKGVLVEMEVLSLIGFSHDMCGIGFTRDAARGFPLGHHKWKQVSLPRTRNHAHIPGICFTASKHLHTHLKLQSVLQESWWFKHISSLAEFSSQDQPAPLTAGQRDGFVVWPMLSWLHFPCNGMGAVVRQALRHVMSGKLNLLPYNKMVAAQPLELSKKIHIFLKRSRISAC